MALAQTSVTFGVRADKLIPAEVSASLGLAPSKAWAKGDAFSTRTGPARQPWGIWSLTTRGILESGNLEDHILYVLERLEPRRQQLARYLDDPDYLTQVYLWYVGDLGYTLPSALLSRLCSVCELLNFSFFDGDQNQAGSDETRL